MSKNVMALQRFFVLPQTTCNNTQLLKKKAVERLCDKSFLLSLLIAFFIVFASAYLLSFIYQGLSGDEANILNSDKAIYMMEKG